MALAVWRHARPSTCETHGHAPHSMALALDRSATSAALPSITPPPICSYNPMGAPSSNALTSTLAEGSKVTADTYGHLIASNGPERRTRQTAFWRSAAFYYGTPGPTRTGDTRFRKPLLYPSELRGYSVPMRYTKGVWRSYDRADDCYAYRRYAWNGTGALTVVRYQVDAAVRDL